MTDQLRNQPWEENLKASSFDRLSRRLRIDAARRQWQPDVCPTLDHGGIVDGERFASQWHSAPAGLERPDVSMVRRVRAKNRKIGALV
jgi:hypothetical protein